MDEATRLTLRGLRLEYATLGWNVTEVAILVVAAIAARSVALAGFALDSVIEIFASVVVVWQLKGSADPGREERAVRWIGVAFLLLAAYLTVQTVVTLRLDVHPGTSVVGIVWLAATTLAMYSLAWAKGRTGRALGNLTLQKEAKVTMIDGSLAAAILLGLVANAWLGWWWADLAAGGVIIVYGLVEGLEAVTGPRST